MKSCKIRVINPTGLHLRPAGNLCKEALKYKSMITFNFKDGTANAKSVLSVSNLHLSKLYRLPEIPDA